MGIISKRAQARLWGSQKSGSRKYSAFHYKCSKREPGQIASAGIRLCGFLSGLVFVMLVCAGQAHSFETKMASAGDNIHMSSSFKNSSPSDINAGPCSPFLGSASFQSPLHFNGADDDAMMDRTRRHAGTAALGVMFGLRFALQPVRYKTAKSAAYKRQNAIQVAEKSGLQFDVWSTEDKYRSNRSALAVAAYRQCQKERALQALRAR